MIRNKYKFDNIAKKENISNNFSDEDGEKVLIDEEINNLKLVRELKSCLTTHCIILFYSWTLVLFAIIFLQGFSICNFSLSITVICSLIGTAFVQVIGTICIILNGLFKQN